MKNSYFVNKNQLQEWVSAAESIKERFGIEKALGYLLGEKFYNLVKDLKISREMVSTIDGKRKGAVKNSGQTT